ncbi:Kelch repeat-containing protein [Flavilitoribacter nigricans]|uniref:Uncharacterized protein n=1 Tax=Flavilitoribacter nigricans (strain ATCC 23147 / DSM 23189 / NBRC 102662 / NCIMB 1420 / SS-2) TaxID=1122177 RepID=A0A2D0N0C4_FLAN2|nr:hypothetical protein [Flavilitoribacter nigricans]PHN02002.1 hypothetical protein CRP01_34415 [Flavilitoribacter nigricans DSM 23189 = NBRC 102662]
MYRNLYIGLILLLILACRKMAIEAYNFFEVATIPYEIVDDGTFSRILLKGRIVSTSTPAGNISDHGFLWSTNLDDLFESAIPVEKRISLGPYAGNSIDFDTVRQVLSQAQTYYFCAYAIGTETKRVLKGAVDSITLNIRMHVDSIARLNDKLNIEISVQNLDIWKRNGIALQAGTLTMRVATKQDFIDAKSIEFFELRSDTTFRDSLVNLNLNTTYYTQLYFNTPEGEYSGEVNKFFIGDGWKRIQDNREELFGATGAIYGQSAYIMGGYESAVSLSTNRAIYRFTPDAAIQTSQWEYVDDLAPYETFAYGIASPFAGGIYFGLGLYEHFSNNTFSKVLPSRDNVLIHPGGNAVPALEKAVVFRHEDKLYFGTGCKYRDDGTCETTGEFWELTKGISRDTIRPIAGLPGFSGGDNKFGIGRDGAVVFELDGMIYVGGGDSDLGPRNDFYRFIPPLSPTDTGSWEFATLFPGPARYDAVAISAGDRAFYGLGYSDQIIGGYPTDWWEFNPNAANGEEWTQRERFPGIGRQDAVAYFLNDLGIVTTGRSIGPAETGGGIKTQLLGDTWLYFPPEK